nr:MAG TPA: hypothetical protein [Caudoviricetes sp.]
MRQNRTDICHGIANKSHSTQWSGGVALSKERKWNGPTLIEFVQNWTRYNINNIEADGLHLDHLFEATDGLSPIQLVMPWSRATWLSRMQNWRSSPRKNCISLWNSTQTLLTAMEQRNRFEANL